MKRQGLMLFLPALLIATVLFSFTLGRFPVTWKEIWGFAVQSLPGCGDDGRTETEIPGEHPHRHTPSAGHGGGALGGCALHLGRGVPVHVHQSPGLSGPAGRSGGGVLRGGPGDGPLQRLVRRPGQCVRIRPGSGLDLGGDGQGFPGRESPHADPGRDRQRFALHGAAHGHQVPGRPAGAVARHHLLVDGRVHNVRRKNDAFADLPDPSRNSHHPLPVESPQRVEHGRRRGRSRWASTWGSSAPFSSWSRPSSVA